MAQSPQRPAPPSRPAPRQEPPRHPAQPPPARPGVAQRDQQPQPEPEPEKEERAVDPAEAGALFRAGHRLKRRGDPPEKWFAAFRLHNTLVICYPVDDEIEKSVLDQDLVLADDPPTQ